jgi:hypothetical protein
MRLTLSAALHLRFARTTLSRAPRSGRAKVERAMDAEIEACVDVEYWTRLDDGRIECGICPRFCKMRPGQRGLCFLRRAREDGGGMELTGYGRSTGVCVDPIEKKPLPSRLRIPWFVTLKHLVLRHREAASKDAPGGATTATSWTILREAKLRLAP